MTVLSTLGRTVGAGLTVSMLLGYFGIVKKFKYPGRLAVYLIVLIVSALYGVTVSVILTLAGKQGLAQHVTARFFYHACRLIMGIKINVINEKAMSTRPAVFISNHQTELDIDILGRMFPPWCSVTAKKALKYYPFLGWFMALSGSVFINRASRTDALKAFDEAKNVVLSNRQSIFMFPEGTRSHYTEPGLLPFKKGAFHFAVQAQIPIVPYCVQNYSTIWSHKNKIIEGGTIDIVVLDPVNTEGMTPADVNDLVDKVQRQMLDTIERIGYARKA